MPKGLKGKSKTELIKIVEDLEIVEKETTNKALLTQIKELKVKVKKSQDFIEKQLELKKSEDDEDFVNQAYKREIE